jgi:hypothetical protein
MAEGSDCSAQRGFPGAKIQIREQAFNVNRQAILGGSASGESYLWDPAPLVENIGRHTVLGSPTTQSLPPNDGSRGLPSMLL